jgi:hypothetical protein
MRTVDFIPSRDAASHKGEAVQILPYWTCPGCHVGRAVHLATGILVLQVPLVIVVTSLFYIIYRLIVVYSVIVVDLVVSVFLRQHEGN